MDAIFCKLLLPVCCVHGLEGGRAPHEQMNVCVSMSECE